MTLCPTRSLRYYIDKTKDLRKGKLLMTLASGRRRGEVHAWIFKSLKHKTGWKEVTVAPSLVFLAKNQVASDGPSIVQPVVIPALKPTLDHSLTENMTLCPTRSLRYYIDKTKDLRKGKHLLFISFKKVYKMLNYNKIFTFYTFENEHKTCGYQV